MARQIMAPLTIAILSMIAVAAASTFADERRPADLLPTSTIFYAEIQNPAELVDLIDDHPLTDRLRSLDQVQETMRSKNYLEFQAVVAVVEAKVGMPWRDLIAAGTGGGVAFAFDAQTKSAALIVKADDDKTLSNLLETTVELARQDATNEGKPDPVRSGEYRGVTAYQIDKAKVAVMGPWLVAVAEPELGKAILDAVLDKPAQTLAGNPKFQEAREATSDTGAGWAYINVEAIRSAGAAADLFKGRTDNPVAELLIGGLLSILQDTPYVTAKLDVKRDALSLKFASPFNAGWISDAREYYFGPDGKGSAPPLLTTDGSVFAMSAYRDISEMWLRAGDLFDQRTQDELAKADSNLTTLFSGKDFGTDVLGSIGPEVQLVVKRQAFAQDRKPAIELPAFALAARMKDPVTMRPELRRTFQSLIGFLNVVGAQNGQPQLDLSDETLGESQVVSASYLVGEDDNPRRLPINFNFEPTVAFSGDRFVLSSTKDLAVGIAEAENQKPAAADAKNTAAKIDFGVLREILSDNRGQLIAQNMLEEGHTKDEAEAEIGTLLELIDFLRSGSVRLSTDESQLRLSLEVKLATDPDHEQ